MYHSGALRPTSKNIPLHLPSFFSSYKNHLSTLNFLKSSDHSLITLYSSYLCPRFPCGSQTSNQQRHRQRTLPCSSAAPKLIPKCTKFLALARRSCTTSMFPCSKDFLLPAFNQCRRVLCESLEIENVLAKEEKNKIERTLTQSCRNYLSGKSIIRVSSYSYQTLTQLQWPCMVYRR